MLLKTAKFFLYTALFSIVVVMPSTFFPFIGGKYYFFRVAVEFALMFAVFSWAFESQFKEYELRLRTILKMPLFLAVSLFALAYLLAAIFAHDPVAAFWSNFERGEGAFQMLHYYLFFV